ncbi:MAG: XrtA/PEP-CTERM system histidine kinase PrsK, partial [Thiohalomonadales bacterium]
MREIGVIGYSIAAFGFSILTFLFITSWKGRTQGVLLVIAALLSTGWAVFAAYRTTQFIIISIPLVAIELAHNLFWIMFIVFVLNKRGIEESVKRKFLIFSSVLAVIITINIALLVFSASATRLLYFKTGFELTVVSLLLVSIFGLLAVEQLFRNATTGERWSLKYLCFGIGGYFAYDIYLYSDALLYKQFDELLWVARGYISSIIIPLIAVSAARNPQWSLDVFVSRKVVFYTASLTMIAVYLLVMALGGYYIKQFGGSWAGVVELLFLFIASLILVALFFSGQFRGKLRVSVNKHFFNYRYDYRNEWLRFIDTLSDEKLDTQLRTRVISAIADIVDSPGGMLWLKNDDDYQLSAVWNVKLAADQTLYDRDIQSLVEYMQSQKHVVDVDEGFLDNTSNDYHFPEWSEKLSESWLYVPLFK